MDTVRRPNNGNSGRRPESEAERQRRLILEAKMIAQADADIAAGRLIDETDIDAWIDSVGTDHELPPPRSRRQAAGGCLDGYATPRKELATVVVQFEMGPS